MRSRTPLLVSAAFAIAACSGTAATPPAWTFSPGAQPAGPVAAASVVEVFKSPTCSCCHEWEAYMRSHGWTVRSMPMADVSSLKMDHGLPKETWSCHTALIDGYVVEGHVPLAAIEDLLSTRPSIDGIALPGMPPGSPGMPGEQGAVFEILAVSDGEVGVFGSY